MKGTYHANKGLLGGQTEGGEHFYHSGHRDHRVKARLESQRAQRLGGGGGELQDYVLARVAALTIFLQNQWLQG